MEMNFMQVRDPSGNLFQIFERSFKIIRLEHPPVEAQADFGEFEDQRKGLWRFSGTTFKNGDRTPRAD